MLIIIIIIADQYLKHVILDFLQTKQGDDLVLIKSNESEWDHPGKQDNPLFTQELEVWHFSPLIRVVQTHEMPPRNGDVEMRMPRCS